MKKLGYILLAALLCGCILCWAKADINHGQGPSPEAVAGAGGYLCVAES